MLARRLEPEVMDTAAEASDYNSMDHSAVNQKFAADFLERWPGDNPILDVGTGPAQIPIEICRQDPRPIITAVDLSSEMLKLARDNVNQAGLSKRISLQLMDAKQLPFPDESFAAVISNAIVHHIPAPPAAFAEMVRVCRRSGLLFIRDLLRPKSMDELHHLVDTYAFDANEHQRSMFADSLMAALTVDEVRAIVSGLGFSEHTVQATSDRHWTWAAKR